MSNPFKPYDFPPTSIRSRPVAVAQGHRVRSPLREMLRARGAPQRLVGIPSAQLLVGAHDVDLFTVFGAGAVHLEGDRHSHGVASCRWLALHLTYNRKRDSAAAIQTRRRIDHKQVAKTLNACRQMATTVHFLDPTSTFRSVPGPAGSFRHARSSHPYHSPGPLNPVRPWTDSKNRFDLRLAGPRLVLGSG